MQGLGSLNISSTQLEELTQLASTDPNAFNVALSGIEGITSGQRAHFADLAQDYQVFATEINGLSIDQEAKDFLIKKAGDMGQLTENTWGDFNISGQLAGATGASGVLSFMVDREWVAKDQQIGVENVLAGFAGIGLVYNTEKKRMEGHMSFEQNFASASVRGDASAVIGGSGWYFAATGEFLLDALEIEGVAGIMFGDHPMETEMDDMFKRVSFYYRKLGD